MDRNEIPHDPCQLGVPSGASKRFSSLSYIKISTISKQAELSLETRHLGLPSGASKTISKPMARLAQTVHLSCADTNTVSKQERSEIPLDPHHIGLPLGASKMISESMVCSTQTVHLSCIKISTISERTETSFH